MTSMSFPRLHRERPTTEVYAHSPGWEDAGGLTEEQLSNLVLDTEQAVLAVAHANITQRLGYRPRSEAAVNAMNELHHTVAELYLPTYKLSKLLAAVPSFSVESLQCWEDYTWRYYHHWTLCQWVSGYGQPEQFTSIVDPADLRPLPVKLSKAVVLKTSIWGDFTPGQQRLAEKLMSETDIHAEDVLLLLEG